MARPSPRLELSEEERRFAEAYVEACFSLGRETGAGELAVRRAALLPPDATFLQRQQKGYALGARKPVQKHIQDIRDGYATRRRVPFERIVEELERIAFTDISDFLEVDPDTGVNRINLSRATPDQRRAIASLTHEMTKLGERNKIAVHDKRGAIDMLNRIHGGYKDSLAVNLSLDNIDKLIAQLEGVLGKEPADDAG